MNARPQSQEVIEAVSREVGETIRRIIASDRAIVWDSGMAERAILAAIKGQPAFYSTASYHNATACCLCNTANLTGDVIAAVRTEFGFHRSDADRERGLHTLVPLNMAGAEALSAAYHRYGVWRDTDELLARRDRVPASVEHDEHDDATGVPSPAELLREHHSRVL